MATCKVFVVGGSAGLGKEISKVMAAQGAQVTIFSRSQKNLEGAKQEILAVCKNASQQVKTFAADMSIPTEVQRAISAQDELPDILYLVAGGTSTECGFLTDIKPEVIERCMNQNYYSSVWPAQTVLKLWTKDDKVTEKAGAKPRIRKLVFVNSSASCAPVPGYVAYSAAKAAQKALADTMRMEAMRYSGPISEYIVQCVFAHNFITPTFLIENQNKSDLLRRIEGTTTDLKDLEAKFPYAEKIAPEIVEAVASNDYAVMDKRLEIQAIWAGSMGVLPRRGWGIVDTLLAILVWFARPFIVGSWERESRGDALR